MKEALKDIESFPKFDFDKIMEKEKLQEYINQSPNNTEGSYNSNDTDVKWKKETNDESIVRDNVAKTIKTSYIDIKQQKILV